MKDQVKVFNLVVKQFCCNRYIIFSALDNFLNILSVETQHNTEEDEDDDEDEDEDEVEEDPIKKKWEGYYTLHYIL